MRPGRLLVILSATMRYRIKICGITEPEHARIAAQAGADALGLVFYARSRRAMNLDQAARVIRAIPPFVATVGLFVDPRPEEVVAVLDGLRLDYLQFHGAEDAAFCSGFGVPYLKAIAMGGGEDPRPEMDAHPDARGFLLDSHAQGTIGGSGRHFDWGSIPGPLSRPWLLAGGLGPGNVGAALARTRPYGVDVSSGVESAPGLKDPELIQQFIKAVRQVESE